MTIKIKHRLVFITSWLVIFIIWAWLDPPPWFDWTVAVVCALIYVLSRIVRWLEFLSWACFSLQAYRYAIARYNRAWALVQYDEKLPWQTRTYLSGVLWDLGELIEIGLVRQRWDVACGRHTEAEYAGWARYIDGQFDRLRAVLQEKGEPDPLPDMKAEIP